MSMFSTKLDRVALKAQYQKWLFDDFLPFMDRYIIDHEYGGFMCNADMNGKLLSTDKNSWFIGRGIWTYSFLCNNLSNDKEYLDVASKAVDFILAGKPAPGQLWNAEFTKEGKPIQSEKGVLIGGKYIDMGGQVYGDLFIAEGLSEYSKAVNDDKLWNFAKDIVLKCIDIYDSHNYSPSAARVYMCSETDMPGARLVGVWMLLLRVCTQMLRMKTDSELTHIADRCLDAIFNHHYNPQYDLINEVLNHDFSRPENEYKDMAYTGHAIETLWMVMDEALRRKDDALFLKASRCLKRHLEVSWDDDHGGFFRCLKDVSTNQWVLDKAGWLQEEVLTGTLMAIQKENCQWAYEWFNKTLSYAKEKLSLEKYGLPLWNPWTRRDGKFEHNIERIENYHHPRHLMLNLLMLLEE